MTRAPAVLPWLLLVACLVGSRAADAQEADDPRPGYAATVRLTHYWEPGLTYSGGHTFIGSAACSWNFDLGTRFTLPTGETFVCLDRGRLGWSGWLDLFGVDRDYLGSYVDVVVTPP